MKNIYILVACVVVVLAYVVLTNPEKNTQSVNDTDSVEYTIGVIAPLTGVVADFGAEARRGIEAVGTTDTKFTFEDDACDPKQAVTAFKKLTELDGVTVILGPLCGSSQEAVAPLAKEKGVVLLVPAAASQSLFGTSGGYAFNTQYSLETESAFNAKALYEKGVEKVVVIGFPNAFSETHVKAFTEAFEGIIVESLTFPPDTVPDAEITKLRGMEFDALYVADISFFFGDGLKKLATQGVSVPIYSTYVVELPIVRPFVNGVIYSFPSDMTDGMGGVYGLSKESVELVVPLMTECRGDGACVKNGLMATGLFDEYGTRIRPIHLKQVTGEVVSVVE